MSEKKMKEAEKLQQQLDHYEESVKTLTMDRMNEAPLVETEPQTKLSSREIAKKPDIYLKPTRSIASREKFIEAFRSQYNKAVEYVKFIAENHEVIGETIENWTKPFPGMPAEFWNVPTNKPVYGPRHLAEQISRCRYHRLKTVDKVATPESGGITEYGTMVVDTTVNRLDARPVKEEVSVFLGANSF